MPISASTISALQKVGAAAFTAHEKLTGEVGSYANRVNAAIFKNPFDLGNDALIESWKIVARLSKTLAGIEEELRSVYRIACDLAVEDQPSVGETPALAAPTPKDAKKNMAESVDLTATTVKVKKAAKKKAAKNKTSKSVAAATIVTTTSKQSTAKDAAVPKTMGPKVAVARTAGTKPGPAKAGTPGKAVKVKATGAAVSTQAFAGNSAKLLDHLLVTLNTGAFERVNQTQLAKATGIPLGSIGAALSRLTKAGRLVSGPLGTYKLTNVPIKAVAVEPSPTPPNDQTASAPGPQS